jgi:hypothetical protein
MATSTTDTKKSRSQSKSDPCWEGYEKIGMKMKNGKLVPNCVSIKKDKKKSDKTKKASK